MPATAEAPASGAEEPRKGIEAEGDNLLNGVNRITSMCPNCQEDGETILFLHAIPHFKELLVSSFSCPHCDYSNREVQTTGSLAARGVHMECRVLSACDLNRQVVRSESCTLAIPEVELEIPPSRSRAELNTIEGFVLSFAENLKNAAAYQQQMQQPETAARLSQLVDRLTAMAEGRQPFLFVLDDPSGNSYIECIQVESNKEETAAVSSKETADTSSKRVDGEAAEGSSSSQGRDGDKETLAEVQPQGAKGLIPLRQADTRLTVRHFDRTREQLHAMGYFEAQEEQEEETVNEEETVKKKEIPEKEETVEKKETHGAEAASTEETGESLGKEALLLPVECPHCGAATTNKVCEIDIPGFRRCLIFAFCCANCGAKNSEIKAAGAYGPAGRRWILSVRDSGDLNRDLLKADTASVEIPSLKFSMEGGAEAGTITTVEGLLKSLADGLSEGVPFASGDSAAEASRKRLEVVTEKLRQLQQGNSSLMPFDLIINDPADLSFVALKKEADRHPNNAKPTHTVDASTHVDGDTAKAFAAAAAAAANSPEASISPEEIEKMLKNAKAGETLWRTQLDSSLSVEVYRRTPEQDDELGLLDMKV